jgi:hypothetical protein
MQILICREVDETIKIHRLIQSTAIPVLEQKALSILQIVKWIACFCLHFV